MMALCAALLMQVDQLRGLVEELSAELRGRVGHTSELEQQLESRVCQVSELEQQLQGSMVQVSELEQQLDSRMELVSELELQLANEGMERMVRCCLHACLMLQEQEVP